MSLNPVTTYMFPPASVIVARLKGIARSSHVKCRHCGTQSETPVWETDRPRGWYDRYCCSRSLCLAAEETAQKLAAGKKLATIARIPLVKKEVTITTATTVRHAG